MSPRFAYFYLMSGDPRHVRAAVPQHVAHWKGLGLTDYLGGPFEDRTGGLITFRANDLTAAQRAVETDPFVTDGLVCGPMRQPRPSIRAGGALRGRRGARVRRLRPCTAPRR